MTISYEQIVIFNLVMYEDYLIQEETLQSGSFIVVRRGEYSHHEDLGGERGVSATTFAVKTISQSYRQNHPDELPFLLPDSVFSPRYCSADFFGCSGQDPCSASRARLCLSFCCSRSIDCLL